MKKYLTLILIIVSIISIAQNKKEFILIDSKSRSYSIHLPTNYNTLKTYPLVFVLHGGLGAGDKLIKSSKFTALSDKENFISVYPNGIKKSWADARNVTKASRMGVNDVKFISELVDKIAYKYSVNKEKIYAVGISNGDLWYKL